MKSSLFNSLGSLPPPRETCAVELATLCFGLGSPGYTGCLGIGSTAIRWGVFTERGIGILASMDRLKLHILGLPGARLPCGTTIPGSHEFQLISRGGPDYGSTALIWRKSVFNASVSEVRHLGSHRRLPVCITDAHGQHFWVFGKKWRRGSRTTCSRYDPCQENRRAMGSLKQV